MATGKIRFFAALLAALTLGLAGGAGAQQKVTLKLGWVTPENPRRRDPAGCRV